MDNPFIPPPPTAASAERPLQPPAEVIEEVSAGKGVKETIESILIAFILAFVFRAFIVEAFVIPTGSMATTLMGANMRFACKECGYQFEAEFRSENRNSDDIEIPSRANGRTFGVYCPNCRYKVDINEAEHPLVRYGDRILVLKYLYIPWISSPHRWDVVVFKTPYLAPPPPRNAELDPSAAPAFTINYIKRLIGLPGEHLMILDGDVYVWGQKSWEPDSASRDKKNWKIQSKPLYAQEAMWRIIYDHDYRPLHEDRPRNIRLSKDTPRSPGDVTEHWTLPWVAGDGKGWDTGDKENSRILAFNNQSGSGVLKFDPTTVPHYDPMRTPGGYFTDWLAYDATMEQDRGDQYNHTGIYSGLSTVSDFKLSFFYERKKGDGPLKAKMTKHDHEFVLEMLPDRLKLIHQKPNKEQVEIPAAMAIDPSKLTGPIRVDFANVDYHVTVRINDKLVFETNGTDPKSPAYFQPDVTELWARYVSRAKDPFPTPTVSFEAQHQESLLSHVSFWRDVYYTNQGMRANPDAPADLTDTEYFVLGDNSAASMDARMWSRRVELPEENLMAEGGRVPSRFMLGRAFFVYWPAGYRPIDSAPALVPNFGDMRLIH